MLGHAVEATGLEKRHTSLQPSEELWLQLQRVSQLQRLLDGRKLLFKGTILTLMGVEKVHCVGHKAPLKGLLLLLLRVLSDGLMHCVARWLTRLDQTPVPERIERLQRTLRDGQGGLLRETDRLGGE